MVCVMSANKKKKQNQQIIWHVVENTKPKDKKEELSDFTS